MESRDNDAISWLSARDEDENDSSSKQPKPLPRKYGYFSANGPVEDGVGAAPASSWVFTPTSPHLRL